MRLSNPRKVPWQESQLIYHALAELGWEALSLVSPSTPYVCIGFHQDVEQEVVLAYCSAHKIPVFRRDLGGGAVYLDGDQLFFQLILHKDHPEVPKNKESFYRKFLQPIVNVYRSIGIPAAYKPVNDILAGTKKISGTGVGEIGDCIVFVGNLIVDFNYEEMSKVLRVPDEKFRDKVHKTLQENLTTIRRELGDKESSGWDERTLNTLMAEEFQKPAWSPDGRSLAYVSFHSGLPGIYVQTLRTGEQVRVSARSGINGAPAWSPDGTQLAVALSRRDGNVDVYLLNLATQELRRLTEDAAIDTEPSWAPDGRSIYFTSDRAGAPQVYRLGLGAGERPRRITFERTYNARPRVSPDGRELAVVTLEGGAYRIAAVDAERGGLRVLTAGRLDESPSYSPNGADIIYATPRGRCVA